MKLTFLFAASALLLLSSSCDKQTCSSVSGIVGEWELVEQLIDIGDGNATFQPITSDKEIKFFDDGTFEANGEMCTMASQSSSIHEGTFDESAETFSPNNCISTAPMSYQYTVNCNTLILTYNCIEECQQKYIRI